MSTVVIPQRMERMLQLVRDAGVTHAQTLEAMRKIPREIFLSRAMAAEAYDDACLPIGEQQTISMPSVVARMTAALDLQPHDKVLEIGTGCGYQTAILAKLAKRVYSVERHASLSEQALKRLHQLKITNVTAVVGDGSLGWPHGEQAPFSAIMVTAAGPQIPPALVAQLAVGGRMVLPVGPMESDQNLVLVTKNADGSVREEALGKVVFVPLVGQQGQSLIAAKRARRA